MNPFRYIHILASLAAVGALAGCGTDDADPEVSAASDQLPPVTTPTSSAPADEPVRTETSPARAPSQAELAKTGTNPTDDRTTLVLDFMGGQVHWWATAWTPDSDRAEADVFCVGTPTGVNCRGDGQRLDQAVEVLYYDQRGVVFITEPEISSLVATASGTSEKLVTTNLGLVSGRLLSAVSRPAETKSLVVEALDAEGTVVQTVRLEPPESPRVLVGEGPRPGAGEAATVLDAAPLAELLPHAPVELEQG